MIWFVACRVLALSAVGIGVVSAPRATTGDPWSAVWRPVGIPIGIHLDLVACLLLAFVGLLGWVVSRYSLTNLRGRLAFTGSGIRLFAALAGLLLTVSGASLVTVAIGWTFSGHAVAALISRSGTERAGAATRTMRRTLLIGDVSLWVGVVAAAFLLPSLERSRMTEVNPGWGTTLVAALLLVACVARTGLVPAHRWLPETAEAPSPISGLLHAGVVNGAGVLVISFWPLFAAAPQTLLVLLVLGVASVIIGAWASRVRADVKGRLACSTTSQMGYMCIELGLGLPGAALLHLVGHGAYKSWLFLRAGGTVARTRSAPMPSDRSPIAPLWTALVAGAITLALALPATLNLVDEAGVTASAAIALAVFAATLAGRAVAGLRRTRPHTVWVVTATTGFAAGAYVWLLLGAEELLGTVWEPEPLWGPVGGTVIVAGLVVVGVLVSRGFDDLETNPSSSLAVWLSRTALPPAAPIRHTRRRTLNPPAVGATPTGDQIDEVVVVSSVVAAASVVGPAWPLRNFVAANPLTHLEPMAFEDALLITGRAHGITGRPELAYFVDLFAKGRITPGQLRAALAQEASDTGDHASLTMNDFVALSHRLASRSGRLQRRVVRRPETGEQARGSNPALRADLHCAVWAQRGWGLASTSSAATGPWELWLDSAAHASYDRAVGITGAASFARTLPRDPAAAIVRLAAVLALPQSQLVRYFVAAFASAPGWTGHASWRSRRGHHIGPLVELAAVRMAHDALLTMVGTPANPVGTGAQADTHSLNDFDLCDSPEMEQDEHQQLLAVLGRVWQRALELGVEEQFLPLLTAVSRTDHPSRTSHPASQSIWCIDVRSEPVRRRMEGLGDHRTYGYAGFFGAAVRHVDSDGVIHELCPGLIEPGFDSVESSTPLTVRQAFHRTVTAVSRHPLGALAIAEGGGLVAAGASTLSVLDPERMRRITRLWVHGSTSTHRIPSLTTELDTAGRADLVEAALRATGLTVGFAPVVVICGHGASPENNAFATAYDCGACGGNDGVVNATLLVDALNDELVRDVLATRGIHLPDDTVAVVALHDTTTGSVDLLTRPDLAMSDQLRSVAADLHAAGVDSGHGSGPALPDQGSRIGGRRLARRAADWSEPTPEWGLAGNAAIVIGPRELTRSIDLSQRVFLHSYEREQDRDGAVLEQLLTAPLVVAQWINAQYYFSAVAPGVFGAGDKTTHNVVGDVGVLSGAHGDLRTGLPWQALFRDQPGTVPDAGNLVHEPVRLLAVIAADPRLICDVVKRHETLTNLVVNEWIHLVCIDAGRTHRLQRDLTWRPWQVASRDETGATKVS